MENAIKKFSSISVRGRSLYSLLCLETLLLKAGIKKELTFFHVKVISFSLIKGTQLLNSVIEIICLLVKKVKMQEETVIEEDFNGHIMRFIDFELEWNKNKKFWFE